MPCVCGFRTWIAGLVDHSSIASHEEKAAHKLEKSRIFCSLRSQGNFLVDHISLRRFAVVSLAAFAFLARMSSVKIFRSAVAPKPNRYSERSSIMQRALDRRTLEAERPNLISK